MGAQLFGVNMSDLINLIVMTWVIFNVAVWAVKGIFLTAIVAIMWAED